ncbi:MAG TPA: 3-hydroxyacyl-CoA dehydrogenase NAD-binding domain-containing protein [Nevskiaceae bacterium]
MNTVLRAVPGKVTIVGSGVIGTSWAAHFLRWGYRVCATDPAAGAEQRLRSDVAAWWPTLRRLGLAEDASLERLSFTTDLAAALHDTDFVQENASERLDEKQRLIAQIDAATPTDVVIASSSSGLLPSQIQARCARPERVLVGHPFHPPYLMPLVEVVGGARTGEAALRRALDLYRSTGKRPIRLRQELPGHVANRLQAALWREAFALVDSGAASVEDIDTAIASGPGLRWALLGPFLTLHLTGGAGGMARILEHLGPSVEAWWQAFETPRLTPELRERVVEQVEALAGRLGGPEVAQRRDKLLVELLALTAAEGGAHA